jgi:hypothetical protein
MNKRIIALACLAVGLVMIVSSCTVTVNNPKPTTAWVHFYDNVSQTVTGGTLTYSVQSLSGLGQSWPDPIAYQGVSALKEITPHSGTFTITGEVRFSGGSWTAGSWDFNQTINAGDTVLITLE